MPNKPVQTAFATWLDTRIKDLGMTQAAIGEYVGTDGVQVMRWRRGKAVPTPVFLSKLADLFGVDRVELERLAYLPDSTSMPASTQVEAERQMWRARYDSLMEKKVPKWAWHVYMDACEALAEAFRSASPGELSTSERQALSKATLKSEGEDPDADKDDLALALRSRRHTQRFASVPAGV